MHKQSMLLIAAAQRVFAYVLNERISCALLERHHTYTVITAKGTRCVSRVTMSVVAG